MLILRHMVENNLPVLPMGDSGKTQRVGLSFGVPSNQAKTETLNKQHPQYDTNK